MTPEQSQEMKQTVHRHIEICQEMDRLSQNIVDAKQRAAEAGKRAGEAEQKIIQCQAERLKIQQEVQSKAPEMDKAKSVARELDDRIAGECITNLSEIETGLEGMSGFEGFIQEAATLRKEAEGYKKDNLQGKVVTQELGQINEKTAALTLKIQSFAS